MTTKSTKTNDLVIKELRPFLNWTKLIRWSYVTTSKTTTTEGKKT